MVTLLDELMAAQIKAEDHDCRILRKRLGLCLPLTLLIWAVSVGAFQFHLPFELALLA